MSSLQSGKATPASDMPYIGTICTAGAIRIIRFGWSYRGYERSVILPPPPKTT